MINCAPIQWAFLACHHLRTFTSTIVFSPTHTADFFSYPSGSSITSNAYLCCATINALLQFMTNDISIIMESSQSHQMPSCPQRKLAARNPRRCGYSFELLRILYLTIICTFVRQLLNTWGDVTSPVDREQVRLKELPLQCGRIEPGR